MVDAAKEYGIDDTTIEGKMMAGLVNRGLFPDQAQAVMDATKESRATQSMQGRWNDKVADYPPTVANVVWISVNAQAIKYIEENCPQHWAKPMFTGETPGGNPPSTPSA